MALGVFNTCLIECADDVRAKLVESHDIGQCNDREPVLSSGKHPNSANHSFKWSVARRHASDRSRDDVWVWRFRKERQRHMQIVCWLPAIFGQDRGLIR